MSGSIVVTGASGSLGHRVVELLLDVHALAPARVRAITRTPARLEAFAARGVDVRAGSFDDADALGAALADADRLLVVSTDELTPGLRIRQHTAAVSAAARAGVEHVVYTSFQNASPDNPAAVSPDHVATELALRGSGLRWTALRNGLYAELLADSLRQVLPGGRWVHNAGEGRTAYVSREDCAGVAAAVLAHDIAAGSGKDGQLLEVTGDSALTQAEVAALAAELTGQPLEPVAVDDEAYAAGLSAAGLPGPVAAMITTFGRAQREGWFEAPSPTVRELTGRDPISLREALRHAFDGAGHTQAV